MIVTIIFNCCDKRGGRSLEYKFACIQEFGEQSRIRIVSIAAHAIEHQLEG